MLRNKSKICKDFKRSNNSVIKSIKKEWWIKKEGEITRTTSMVKLNMLTIEKVRFKFQSQLKIAIKQDTQAIPLYQSTWCQVYTTFHRWEHNHWREVCNLKQFQQVFQEIQFTRALEQDNSCQSWTIDGICHLSLQKISLILTIFSDIQHNWVQVNWQTTSLIRRGKRLNQLLTFQWENKFIQFHKF